MKLTLRTLLAFLNQSNLNIRATKNIQSKIDETKGAQVLLDRLQSIVNEPNTGAMRFDADGMPRDPNLVASYLDNTMPDDSVKEFEKFCIDSNLLLSEVTLSHEMLTHFFRDQQPAVYPELRQRIYEMGHTPFSLSNSEESTQVEYLVGSTGSQENRVAVIEEPGNGDSKEIEFKLSPPPEESTEKNDDWASSWSDHDMSELQVRRQRRWAIVRNTIGIGGAFALLVGTYAFWYSNRQTVVTPQQSESQAKLDRALEAQPVKQWAFKSRFDDEPGLKREDMIARIRNDAANQEAKNREDKKKASVEPKPQPIEKVEIEWPEAAEESIVERIVVELENPSEVALIPSLENGEVHRWAPGTTAYQGQPILSFPGYRPRLVIDSKIAATIIDNSSFSAGGNRNAIPRLNIHYGRLVIENMNEQVSEIDLVAGGIELRLTLTTSDAAVGIELLHSLESGDNSGARFRGIQAVCLKGSCVFSNEEQFALAKGDALVVDLPENVFSFGKLNVTPTFFDPDQEGDAEALTVVSNSLGPDADVEKVLRGLLDDERANVKLQAAKCLLSLSHFDVLVQMLGDSSYRSVWTQLIDCSIDQLAKNGKVVEELNEWLMDKTDEEKMVLELLLGYSDDQLKAGKDELLVSALVNEELAIRVLAIERLRRITGFSLLYRPEVENRIRAPYVDRWKHLLEKGTIRWDRPNRPPYWVLQEASVPEKPPEPENK